MNMIIKIEKGIELGDMVISAGKEVMTGKQLVVIDNGERILIMEAEENGTQNDR